MTNRALAAMQFAKEQKNQEQAKSVPAQDTATPPTTNLFDTKSEPKPEPKADAPKTELKPAFLNSELAKPTEAPAPKKPEFVRVDLSIAGTPHRISCPANEVAALNRNADRLNENLREIRRSVGSKSPSNEELLVLHCLELYDQISDLKKQLQDGQIHNERSNALLDKLIKDTQAMIKV